VRAIEDGSRRCPLERERIEIGQVVGMHGRPAILTVTDMKRRTMFLAAATIIIVAPPQLPYTQAAG